MKIEEIAKTMTREGKKAYKGWEILKMIEERELKEGQELEDEYGLQLEVKKLKLGLCLKYKNGEDFPQSTGLQFRKFIIKKKKYMTFDEARKLGIPKHIKCGYDTPIDNIPPNATSKDCENAMKRFIKAMDEKVWYVEEKE